MAVNALLRSEIDEHGSVEVMVKKSYPDSSRVDALGRLFREIVAPNGTDWNECLYRQEVAPGQTSFSYTYRAGRSLAYIEALDEDKLEQGR